MEMTFACKIIGWASDEILIFIRDLLFEDGYLHRITHILGMNTFFWYKEIYFLSQ